jgi:hypothetical protein
MAKSFVITEVRGPFVRETKAGKEVTKICLNGASDEAVFLTLPQVKAKAHITSNFDVLVGMECTPTFFEVGEKLKNGEECNKADWILKDCKIKKPAMDMAISKCAAYGASVDISGLQSTVS